MYTVVYVVDEHDRLYGGTTRTFTDQARALQFAAIVDALGVYDAAGMPVLSVKSKPKASSKETK